MNKIPYTCMASEKCKVRGRLVSYVDMLLIAGGCIHLFDEVVRRHNKLSSIKINGALLHAHRTPSTYTSTEYIRTKKNTRSTPEYSIDCTSKSVHTCRISGSHTISSRRGNKLHMCMQVILPVCTLLSTRETQGLTRTWW